MFLTFINELKNKLEEPLPGMEAQFEMAHLNRERVTLKQPEANEYKPSAVLVLLYPNEENDTVILLIERPIYEGYHSGQIALPGGKAEPYETDLMETAMREFFEETGCDQTPEVIGKLSPIFIPVSKFMVQPYIAFLESKPEFSHDENEVSQLLEWKLNDLLNPETIKETTIEVRNGIKFKTPYFDVQRKILWGATAMMLNELKWVLQK
jgi:8-oxo-dGTP pyrophosphatase MutT (NUDIX family)